jgi:hypothetical protein
MAAAPTVVKVACPHCTSKDWLEYPVHPIFADAVVDSKGTRFIKIYCYNLQAEIPVLTMFTDAAGALKLVAELQRAIASCNPNNFASRDGPGGK